MTARIGPLPLPLALDVGGVVEGRLLGRGGQGRVVEVSGGPIPAGQERLAAKWYLPSVRLDAAALTRLVAWRRSLPGDERAALDRVACWPRCVLLRDGRAAGVLLPLAPDRFHRTVRLPSGSTGRGLRELQHLIAGPALLARRRVPDVGTVDRLRVLAGFADTVAFLHDRGVVLGDLSVKNLLWCCDNATADTYLLDCDALRLTGTDPAVPQPNSPGWDDPAFPGTQNQQSDRYKLALAVLRVLARDFHTRDPERAAAAIGRRFLPLLRAGLDPRPDVRPPAASWPGPLSERSIQLQHDESEEVSSQP